MEHIIVVNKTAKKFKDNIKDRTKKLKCDRVLLAKLFIASTVILTISGIILSILLSLSVQNKLIQTTTTTTTTLSSSNNSTGGVTIGESCVYSNQCPQYAFCEGTCKCPLHYYFNGTVGKCNIRKTYGVSCSSNYECNTIVGLICSTTCQCDSVHYWNSTYVLGGGLPNGRCQNVKTHGQACNSWAEASSGTTGLTYGSPWSTQISRCYCQQSGWYLNHKYGTCYYYQTNMGYSCLHSSECEQGNTVCMSANLDGNKRCVPQPNRYEWGNWIYTKYVYTNTGCWNWQNSATVRAYPCNQWQNLICVDTNNYGTCMCIDQYYYYNYTSSISISYGSCVRGSMIGQACTTATQCVPTTAGFSCIVPYTGAANTVCMCATTQYYDVQTGLCTSLKYVNSTCRDTDECYGGVSGSMICGQYYAGSPTVCMCTDSYYQSGTNCVAKITAGSYCSGSSYNYQCYGYLNQTCVYVYLYNSWNWRCYCATGLYFDANGQSCKQLLYRGDSCSSSSQCWSGTCSSSLCT